MGLKELFKQSEECEHTHISITGKDGLEAIYICNECGERIYPWEEDEAYRPR